MSLIESLGAVKWEVLAGQSTSQCGVASRHDVISSLVAGSCLRPWQHGV